MVDVTETLPMTPAQSAAVEAATPPHRAAGALAQFAWALFDGARVPYNVLVNIFVFSAYFSTVVIPDAVRGQVVWSGMTSTAAIIVALTAPVLGAVADAGGRRKPWLVATLVLGVPSMIALWFATPGMGSAMIWILAALVGGSLSFEYSAIFCNAMLPNIAARERIGFLSGLGFALGNASGIILFVFFLAAWSWNPHPLFGLSAAAHQPERAVGILAGLWFLVLGLPLFLFTPDSPAQSRSIPEAVVHGVRTLADTVAKARRYRNVVNFLVARMSYNEGFVSLMMFTGVFAAGILHWTPTMLIAEGLINSVVATLAGLATGWFDSRFGSKATTLVVVAGCMLANVVLCSVTPDMVFFIHVAPPAVPHGLFPSLPDKVFLVAQTAAAGFVTAGLVTSRSMMAKLSPRALLNEFFGLYALSGTATSFVGPLAVGVLTVMFHNQRVGVAVGVVFMAAGLLLMIPVREEPAEDA